MKSDKDKKKEQHNMLYTSPNMYGVVEFKIQGDALFSYVK